MRWKWLAAVLVVALVTTGCQKSAESGSTSGFAVVMGDPIPGLTDAQLASFNRGKVLMEKRFSFAEGLGPSYNAASCQACHEKPVTGGSAPNYRNFFLGAMGPPGDQEPINPLLPSLVVPSYGPPQLSLATPPMSPNLNRVRIPPGSVVATRNAPPMFGTGLFEFVSDDTILGHAAAQAGGRRRRHRSREPRRHAGNIGRFGYKCQANSIEPFIRGAASRTRWASRPSRCSEAGLGGPRLGRRPAAGGRRDPTTRPRSTSTPSLDPEMSVATSSRTSSTSVASSLLRSRDPAQRVRGGEGRRRSPRSAAPRVTSRA